jgi:hypothetical protein
MLEQASAFARLRESANIALSLFDPSEIDTTNYGDHGVLVARNRPRAPQRRRALIIPDLLYANGTLISVGRSGLPRASGRSSPSVRKWC